MTKSYSLRLTQDEWRAIEVALRSVSHNETAAEALRKVSAANDVLRSVKDDPDDPSDTNDNNGHSTTNGNGGGNDGVSCIPAFSRKETLVLKHLIQGKSNKAIALALVMTESTVKVHMKAVLRKLRLSSRTQAALWAQTYLQQ